MLRFFLSLILTAPNIFALVGDVIPSGFTATPPGVNSLMLVSSDVTPFTSITTENHVSYMSLSDITSSRTPRFVGESQLLHGVSFATGQGPQEVTLTMNKVTYRGVSTAHTVSRRVLVVITSMSLVGPDGRARDSEVFGYLLGNDGGIGVPANDTTSPLLIGLLPGSTGQLILFSQPE